MSCGIGHRCCSNPELLWLWHRQAATALIQPLTWEPPNAKGAAQKRPKKIFLIKKKHEELSLKHLIVIY